MVRRRRLFWSGLDLLDMVDQWPTCPESKINTLPCSLLSALISLYSYTASTSVCTVQRARFNVHTVLGAFSWCGTHTVGAAFLFGRKWTWERYFLAWYI